MRPGVSFRSLEPLDVYKLLADFWPLRQSIKKMQQGLETKLVHGRIRAVISHGFQYHFKADRQGDVRNEAKANDTTK